LRNFLKNKITVAALVIIITVFAASVLLTLFAPGTSIAHKIAGTIVSPFQRLFTAVRTGISDFWAAQTKYDELLAENKQLKAQIREMQDLVDSAEQYKNENEKLRELLEMRESNTNMTIESALIIAWNDTSWSSVFTINRGAKSGISLNDCVMTESGLVGIVTRVEENFSEVSTVIDTTTSIGACDQRTGVIAVATGDFELMKQSKLKLSNIALGSDVKNGDKILTTGVTGNLPPDIVIGTVDYVRTEKSGMTDYAVITPCVDLKELTQVFVVVDFSVEN
jgi:rod shape-determining protein MreC